MSTKPEEQGTAPPTAAESETPAPSATTEKQEETATSSTPAVSESKDEEKNVDEAAAGVADLSVEEKKDSPPTEHIKNVEEPSREGANTPTQKNLASGPVWPETSAEHPLTQLYNALPTLISEADGYSEVYGITLSHDDAFYTKLILQKFLRANQNDLGKAKEQLRDTLKWRKQFNPVKAADEIFEREKFAGLGYVIEVEGVPGSQNKKDVVTFNVYGAVKDNKKTFGDLESFLRWRVALMERSVQKLNLHEAKEPIPDFGQGPDPYQGIQVHDYLQVSFVRQDPHVKAASKKTIEVLGRYYPETLSRKFFVNVPVIMGWMFTAMKLFVSKETTKKFTVLSYGNQLDGELGQDIPSEYGGKKTELKSIGEGTKLT